MPQPTTIAVTLEGGRRVECAVDTPVDALLPGRTDDQGRHYLGALVNNQVVSRVFRLEVDSDVRFLTFADPLGWQAPDLQLDGGAALGHAHQTRTMGRAAR